MVTAIPLQCFDTVGWVTVRVSVLQKNPSALSSAQRFSFGC